jgi:DNA repair protein RAD51
MADIKKLLEGNIYTVDALAHMPKRELTNIKGLSDAKVEKMQKEGAAAATPACWAPPPPPARVGWTLTRHPRALAAWKMVPMGFTTASIVAEQRQDILRITTGCKEVDNILEGGWLGLEGGLERRALPLTS